MIDSEMSEKAHEVRREIMKTKFNFKRGSKTPKGKPASIRIITKDHDAFKIYQRGLDLRREKGLPFSSVLTDAEVKEAMESLKNEGG